MKTLSQSLPLLSRRFSQVLVASIGLLPFTATAVNDVTQLKLFGRWTNTSAFNYQQGGAVAMNGKWIVSGAQFGNEQAAVGQGAVQVYNASTGAWVRKILPPAPAVVGMQFGSAVALSGDVAVVGANGAASGAGLVYVYNLTTGALVRTLSITGAATSDALGTSVAISGNRVLAGATGYNTYRGAVYVFDLTTGAALGRFDSPGVTTGDGFGTAIAVDGNLALIGAPGINSFRGAGYLYNLETLNIMGTFAPSTLVGNDAAGQSVAISGERIFLGAPNRNGKGAVFCARKYDPATSTEIAAADSVAGDRFGSQIAADAGMLLVSSPVAGSSAGAVHVFDVGAPTITGTYVRKITALDAQSNASFGASVALWGNTGVVGCPNDNTINVSMGALYMLKPLVAPLSAMAKVAAKGDVAPGAVDVSFNVLGDPVVNGNGRVAFASTLTGAGSNAGKDNGVWTTNVPSNSLKLVYKSRSVVASTGNQVVVSASTPFLNGIADVIVPLTMQVGTGSPAVTAAKSKWLINQNGSVATPSFLTANGITPSVFGLPSVLSFGETVQGSATGHNYWASVVTLTGGTTTANDSGLIVRDSTNEEAFREGVTTVPSSSTYLGQFTGRVSLHFTDVIFSAATLGTTTTNQVVLQKTPMTGSPVIVMQKGDTAPEALDMPVVASLLGEATESGVAMVRGTLSGGNPAVTAATNEAIWMRTAAGVKTQVLRKGQTVYGTNLTVAKIINIWMAGLGASTKAFALVQLAGTGVTAVNDQALILIQEGNSLATPNHYILMREGDPAPGCGTGTVGTINRVSVDSYFGHYVILATLAGVPTGTELALFSGRLTQPSLSVVGNATTSSILRRPGLYLRKGWLFDGQLSKIKSISIPATQLTASGFGSTGRPHHLSSDASLAITLEFDNGVKQIMLGKLP